jgi:hypothetical protein
VRLWEDVVESGEFQIVCMNFELISDCVVDFELISDCVVDLVYRSAHFVRSDTI